MYSAGELPIEGADSTALQQGIKRDGIPASDLLKDHAQLPELLQEILQDGDILLMQGAGNIGALASNLAVSQLRQSVVMPCIKRE